MKEVLVLLLIISSVFTLPGKIFCQEDSYISEHAPGELIVKFKPDAFNAEGELISESIIALNEENELVSMDPVFKGEVNKELKFIYKLEFDASQDIRDLVEIYSKDISVVYAEPNYIAHIAE